MHLLLFYSLSLDLSMAHTQNIFFLDHEGNKCHTSWLFIPKYTAWKTINLHILASLAYWEWNSRKEWLGLVFSKGKDFKNTSNGHQTFYFYFKIYLY